MFYGVQKGAIEALKSPKQWFSDLNAIYAHRRKLVWQLAKQLECDFDPNSCGLFVWGKLQNGLDSEQFIDMLLYDKHVFIAPGTIFGSNGNGYVRFSLCATEDSINEAITRTR